MSEVLEKAVPLQKKKSIEGKKKPMEAMEKEVWNLTGGIFPVMSSSTERMRSKDEPVRQWVYTNIVLKNQTLSAVKHWVPFHDKDKVFACEKFNIKTELIQFSEDEYNEHLKDLDQTWNLLDTKQLWELCAKYDLRFSIIADRFVSNVNRNIEDLKQRYYTVMKKILEVKEQLTHPLINYKFDPEYEKLRKFELEKFLMRTKETTESEKNLQEALRKVDIQIKKDEREHLTLQKALKEQINVEDHENDEDCVKIVQEVHEQGRKEVSNPTESICYLRGKWLNEPLPISEKMNKKLNLVLGELCVPRDFVATEDNERLFEELREQIFKLFSLQKAVKKREVERKQLEEKRKIMKEGGTIQHTSSNPVSLKKGHSVAQSDDVEFDKITKKIKI